MDSTKDGLKPNQEETIICSGSFLPKINCSDKLDHNATCTSLESTILSGQLYEADNINQDDTRNLLQLERPDEMVHECSPTLILDDNPLNVNIDALPDNAFDYSSWSPNKRSPRDANAQCTKLDDKTSDKTWGKPVPILKVPDLTLDLPKKRTTSANSATSSNGSPLEMITTSDFLTAMEKNVQTHGQSTPCDFKQKSVFVFSNDDHLGEEASSIIPSKISISCNIPANKKTVRIKIPEPSKKLNKENIRPLSVGVPKPPMPQTSPSYKKHVSQIAKYFEANSSNQKTTPVKKNNLKIGNDTTKSQVKPPAIKRKPLQPITNKTKMNYPFYGKHAELLAASSARNEKCFTDKQTNNSKAEEKKSSSIPVKISGKNKAPKELSTKIRQIPSSTITSNATNAGFSIHLDDSDCKSNGGVSEEDSSIIQYEELHRAAECKHISFRSTNVNSEILKRKSMRCVSSPAKRSVLTVRELRKKFSPNNTPAKYVLPANVKNSSKIAVATKKVATKEKTAVPRIIVTKK